MTADKRTLQRQYDGISADLERIQKTCDDLSSAKNNAEAGYMNRDAEVTRMKFTIQKLEQDVDNKTEVMYWEIFAMFLCICFLCLIFLFVNIVIKICESFTTKIRREL